LEKNTVESSKCAESSQIEFFCDTEPQILTELKNIDINALSPIETFNILKNWKERYK